MLFEALQLASKARGYTVSKRRTSDIDKATNRPYRFDLVYICGGKSYTSKALRRNTTLQYTNCLQRAKAVYTKADDIWHLTILDLEYNYQPIMRPHMLVAYRWYYQTDEVKAEYKRLLQEGKLTYKHIVEQLNQRFEGLQALIRDVKNIQLKIQAEKYRPYIATQLFLQELQ